VQLLQDLFVIIMKYKPYRLNLRKKDNLLLMETTTHPKSTLAIAAILAVMLLATMACSIGGLTINGNSATIDVTLNQEQVNTLLTSAQVNIVDNNDRLLDKVTAIEFHDGFVRTTGTATDKSGKEITGSYDVSFSAANDVLVVKIIAVNIAGVTMDDPRITTANQEIADGINKSISDSHGEVLYKEASVSAADGLHLKIQANFTKK